MIEKVKKCPLCGRDNSYIVYQNVPDFVFSITNEAWNVSECYSCHSLYLDERPTQSSISRYYDRYYTHKGEQDAVAISGISLRSSTLQLLANSYRNAFYGTRRRSLGFAGALLVRLLFPIRQWIDAECRHIPQAAMRCAGFAILDIGCGDGRFVRFARDAGCRAAGVEVDALAASTAASDGLDVSVGDALQALLHFGPQSFDYITLSHVVEHLHDPHQTLAAIWSMLKPGGVMWLETPNSDAFGRRIFGNRWRDLDPPRHIFVSAPEALISLAEQAGFKLRARHRRPLVPFEVFPFSAEAQAASKGTKTSRATTAAWSIYAEIRSYFIPANLEWTTISFVKTQSR
jgi:SAM-dependent methyltransferase